MTGLVAVLKKKVTNKSYRTYKINLVSILLLKFESLKMLNSTFSSLNA